MISPWNKTFAAAVVCDGIGSFKNSEKASQIMTDALKTCITWLFRHFKRKTPDEELVVDEVENAVYEAGREIYLHNMNKEDLIGCTMSMILTIGDVYYLFHVGDSRIYRLRAELTQLTEDEVITFGSEAGEKHKLANYVGKTEEVDVLRRSGQIESGDIFLVGSDGVFHNICQEDLEKRLVKAKHTNQLKGLCKRWIYLIRKRGEKDNASCVIMKAVG